WEREPPSNSGRERSRSRGSTNRAEVLAKEAGAAPRDRAPGTPLYQNAVRRHREAPPATDARHVAVGEKRVDLAFVLTLDVDCLAPLPFHAGPLEVHAEGLFAELEQHHLAGLLLAPDLLLGDEAGLVAVERGVALGGQPGELAQLGLRIDSRGLGWRLRGRWCRGRDGGARRRQFPGGAGRTCGN